jgi:predicted CoA-binding protein
MEQPIAHFLSAHRIAVVGVSRQKGFGNTAFRVLRQRGWEVVPVNAAADAVEGERCFRRLAEVAPPPEAVLLVTPPSASAGLVEECARLGIRRVWLQQGAESEEALRVAAARGIAVVHHACILMYAAPSGLHRLHGWLHRLRASR